MRRRIIVLADDPPRAALVVGGRLEDLLIDPPSGADRPPMPGEIWPARIDRMPKGVAGAFASLGEGRTGHLREREGLRPGQRRPVQVVATAEPGKAVPVSPRILIKGRRLILTPGAPGVNVSRQIRDPAERARLAAAVAAPDDGTGVILRSAAAGAAEAELEAERRLLLAELARALGPDGAGPQEVAPVSPHELALREWTDPPPDAILAGPELCRRLRGADLRRLFFADPALEARLEDAGGDPFARLELWEEIARLLAPRVDLPGEAFMYVEPTRACVTVDVNTGGDFSPAAGLKATLAAMRELPRQLRLRGLGGKIVIDPAALARRDRRTVEESLKAALKRCPIETSFAGWSALGHIELNRKRERRPLSETLPREALP
ncbi:MAG: ribonuclease G [Alphaproteobacteria bacterium]|nr:MAG: ribonuclease G [Alphaproteobacteria bacterium]